MAKFTKKITEAKIHQESKGRTLVVGIRSYERMKLETLADRVIIVDARLPPTTCNRLSSKEYVCGGLQMATEIAGEGAVLWDVDGINQCPFPAGSIA